MSLLRDVLQTVFRMAPWPTEPGLRAVGRPDEWSPVLITANYDLTVRRLLRALEGVNVWVVVAPARGINVWCAASGGHLTTHQVVTALKTSGVAERVRHRRAVLPQLAATGVIAGEIRRRCGWIARFGPVYAEDVPRYLAQGQSKDESMRRVRFGVRERVEMAMAWGGPMALVSAGAALALRPAWAAPLAAFALALALAVFLVYDRIPGPRRLVAGTAAALAAAAGAWLGGEGPAAVGVAAACGMLLFGILTVDYAGSTPIAAGSHFEERSWRVVLDPERCEGVFRCWEVCPEACYEKREELRKVEIAHGERCVRCGACVVQCPEDALAFEDAAGRRVEPDVIRRYKLNLLGRRRVDAGPPPADEGAAPA